MCVECIRNSCKFNRKFDAEIDPEKICFTNSNMLYDYVMICSSFRSGIFGLNASDRYPEWCSPVRAGTIFSEIKNTYLCNNYQAGSYISWSSQGHNLLKSTE